MNFSPEQAIAILVTLVAGLFYFYKRSLRYLQYFQQEEYEGGRFVRWFLANKAWDKITTALLAVPVIASFIFRGPLVYGILVLVCGALVYVAMSEEDPLKAGKLTLKMTDRVKRIHRLAILFHGVAMVLVAGMLLFKGENLAFPLFLVYLIFFVQSNPFWLLLSNSALDPYEKSLQEGFADEARARLKECAPRVIGITGSYGKTSTKILLKDILGSSFPTFSTPGSVNTYMGVTRKIREEMKPEHKFAVIEMGAYYEGSISRMCSLTPPDCALVTTVGLAHLERFGSQETIYRAKSELPQAVPEDGVLVVNGDNEFTRRMATEYPKKHTYIYGMDSQNGHLDSLMTDIVYDDEGTRFKITWQGEEYEGFTRLLGKPMLQNVLGAFTMACAVGVSPDMALAAIRNAKAESNRLELQKGPIAILAGANGKAPREGKVVRLNDAYNSNPVGFDSALEVLSQISGNRKILVTPGMVELGDKQMEENRLVASKAAGFCDLVLVIGDTNSDALISGLKDGGLDESKFRKFSQMKEALSYLATEYCESGDIVLIENDLPDLYEGVVKF